jgi:DNA-binding transcriptional MerR regulator
LTLCPPPNHRSHRCAGEPGEEFVNSPNVKDELLTAAECAKALGLTVRALRIYEERELISPRRTAKGWRVYGAAEISRLHEVLALKRLGLNLSQIGDLLRGKTVNLDLALALQQSMLLELKERTNRSLSLLNAARERLSAGGSFSVGELIELSRETTMTETSLDVMAQRRYEQARPRTAIQIDPALLGRYAGHYQFEWGQVITIEQGKNGLTLKSSEIEIVEFAPESETVFFSELLPAQISFVVGQGDEISGLVLHQKGHEQVAMRINAISVHAAAVALADRIQNNRAFSNSETILRQTIAEHQSGNINYASMTAALAIEVERQKSMITAALAAMGELKAVIFKCVGQDGWDVYELRFEKSGVECRIMLTPDDKIAGMLLRPLP